MGRQEIGLQELRKIQLIIMDELDSFCRKNNIKYFLTGGTLIGAIRHKGYIPWDDDIDIALLRQDYDRLLGEFKSDSGDIDIISGEKTKGCIYPYAKAIHNQTVLIESDDRHRIGVYIDIFPIDNMPSTINECKKLNDKIQFYQRILTLKYLRLDKKRSFIKNMIVIIGRVFRILPDKWIIDNICRLHKSVNYQTEFVSTLTGVYGTREVVRKEVYSKCVDGDFEERKYLIPQGYHELLTNQYGDYMKLPPEDKRVSTHRFIAYWENREGI